MKKLLIYSFLAVFLAFPVSAQTGTTTGNTLETDRERVRSEIMEMRDDFKTRMDAEKAELQGEIQDKREALRAQLQKVKDERRREVVERIDVRLDELNARMLDHFSNVLDRLEDVLERIASRADKAEGRGLDVSTVRTAITDALSSITSARTAVQVQAGKTCIVTVTTENNLRVDVGKARKCLHDNLTVVREAVKAAKEAVRRAATTLAQIPRVDEDSTSPSQEQ
ncbi:MAG: hypothetical protein A3E61_02490 [Candidatus Colwellbacteria bacterium RIFCSPHIGHO2_12_FULL_43_12]|uniref:DUF5667 domain-containing protein n=1 Tax=Candidatus Colwellbacteria bacterium RIFCSPHIGHO2_12_FULL_43_12 TaxID=1797688 RepID=A0A1G1Z2U0_9BACT|nr:MAG: hypothetical protein A3E61_02490 [Candidatus Colwellbacteria bacterium RIFCSPHIGHO2_12_FULL_43_12]